VELIYPMVTHDYNLQPIKPVLMAEGAYEQGSEYGFEVNPLWIRRQAYYSYLAGGHHAYGHNDSWRILPTWKQALDAPGAVQLGILKRVFQERSEWWYLVPDQSIFAAGGRTESQILNLAARHKDGKWVMVYLGGKASFSIHMDKLVAAQVDARWIDPKTGDSAAAGTFSNTGTVSFSTPQDWEDALLILESAEAGGAAVPSGAAALGYTKCVINEKPAAADIDPGHNGGYKWFSGQWWNSKKPPLSKYSTQDGVLALSLGGDLVSAPHDFSPGKLPLLPGRDGFYVELEYWLSDSDPDHWPAVWLMPAEHNGACQDHYAGDPPGYERWMELDIDEGGFRPGLTGTVHSSWGIYEQGWQHIQNPNNNSRIALDRTKKHVFGASFDPQGQTVTWWVDGAKQMSAGSPYVPEVGTRQNFYLIISAQSHGKQKPYSLFVSGVRAYVPPNSPLPAWEREAQAEVRSGYRDSIVPPGDVGAKLYVSPSGDDTNPGTAEKPWHSLQKAAEAVKPGDTVIVRDGVYTAAGGEECVVTLRRGGTADRSVIFHAEHKWGAVVDGRGNATKLGWNLGREARYVTIEGFEIRNLSACGIDSNAGTDHLTVRGCHIHHIGNIDTTTRYGLDGIFDNADTSYHVYEGNVFHHIGRTGPPSVLFNLDHGIYPAANTIGSSTTSSTT